MNSRSLSYLVLIVSFLIPAAGCGSSHAEANNPLNFNHPEPMIVLFSDENSIYDEAHFYDALLEIQRKYPNESFPFQFVFSTEREAIKYFNITTYPTLIVFDSDDNIILRLDESYQKEEIVQKLLEIFQIDKQQHDT